MISGIAYVWEELFCPLVPTIKCRNLSFELLPPQKVYFTELGITSVSVVVVVVCFLPCPEHPAIVRLFFVE